MLIILTRLIAIVIAIAVSFIIVTSFWDLTPAATKTFAIIAIVLGIIMALTGLIVKGSKPKISESIGRKEFYGVIVVLFGWTQLWIITLGNRIDQLGTRVDQLYQLLINIPK